jgi:hypothetical protein
LRSDEERAFGRIVATGFFDVDVLSGFDSGDGHGCMPVIGSGDGDGVDILTLENFAEIAFGVRRVAEFFLGFGAELVHEGALNVADRGDASGVPVRGKGGEMRIAAAVQSYDGEVETVVGSDDLRIAFRGSADGEAGRADGHGVQKFATSDHAVSIEELN